MAHPRRSGRFQGRKVMMIRTRNLLMSLAVAAALAASPALAQAPQTQIVRGTIEKVDGSMVTVKDRSGSDIRIFPDWIKPPQFHGPHDLRPNSTMTNAVVEQTVTGVEGQVLTVKYPQGEKKIVIAPETQLLTYERGNPADIKVGAQVLVRAAKQPDGSLTAAGVTNTRDGSLPPQ
jgi:hypothetical protein